MTGMSRRTTYSLRHLIGGFLFASIRLVISYHTIIQDSPAPGCIERIRFGGIGGCFGKTAIIDLQVTSAPPCLEIAVNNCNGGVREVQNKCEAAFEVRQANIAPRERVTLDVMATGNEYIPVSVSSNFSQYVPAQNTPIELIGTLDDQALTVRFTKTAKLCE